MRKTMSRYAGMRAVGAGIVVYTMGGAAFAVAGAIIGPADLVGGALAVGGGLVGVAHVLERRAGRKSKGGV